MIKKYLCVTCGLLILIRTVWLFEAGGNTWHICPAKGSHSGRQCQHIVMIAKGSLLTAGPLARMFFARYGRGRISETS
jgi:hypothetical protein